MSVCWGGGGDRWIAVHFDRRRMREERILGYYVFPEMTKFILNQNMTDLLVIIIFIVLSGIPTTEKTDNPLYER